MKKIILGLIALMVFSVSGKVKAATWTMAADTVYATVDSNGNIYDTVLVSGSGTVTLNWKVINSNFPTDWLTEAAFGICDNSRCVNNTGGTFMWNPATMTGTSFSSAAYSAGPGDYHMALNLKYASSGTHFVTCNIQDASLNNRTVTFIITHPVNVAVPQVPNADNSVTLYPNPAHNDLNVVYDAASDVKNIAIYNIIGKVMTVYKVSGGSANLNLEQVPSGIYFVRLYNSTGSVIATRKFTKQ